MLIKAKKSSFNLKYIAKLYGNKLPFSATAEHFFKNENTIKT